jgi:hypothetical protein
MERVSDTAEIIASYAAWRFYNPVGQTRKDLYQLDAPL